MSRDRCPPGTWWNRRRRPALPRRDVADAISPATPARLPGSPVAGSCGLVPHGGAPLI
jgi:hypothetical protein